MRTSLGLTVAAALAAVTLPVAAQAQDYRYGYSDRYDHGSYDRDYYRTGYGYHDHRYRDHERWEHHREREARRAHRRWLREHRYDRDYAWDYYR